MNLTKKQKKEQEKPKPKLKLIGANGNAFMILGLAQKVLRQKGMEAEFKKFEKEATSGDYNKLLQTCHKYFEVC